MKAEFLIAKDGKLIFRNFFQTERGMYRIEIRNGYGKLFLFKYLNDNLVECQNLTDSKGSIADV